MNAFFYAVSKYAQPVTVYAGISAFTVGFGISFGLIVERFLDISPVFPAVGATGIMAASAAVALAERSEVKK